MKNKNKKFIETSIHRPLEEVVSEVFGRYAKYIIQDRALPDLRDGLKPVQRRILYVAHLKKLTHKTLHKKSTNLVGEVMGNFHPHGDSSIYDAIVRMAQPWKSNITLLEMHGNVGSIDGDPAAASRYTEVRLGAVSEWMLANIEKQTVPFINNFDDTQKEPTVLPALFFNLLINGSSGIAAGYATNIPPFNPIELSQVLIKLIDYPNLSTTEILKILPAPDFPTKATIEVDNGIEEAYTNGKGKFYIHANYSFVENTKYNQIIFDDIPFEVNKANVIREIDQFIWKNTLADVIEVRDESDRQGLSIVLDLNKNANVQTIINFLYKNTDLRISYNINFVVIHERKPQLMSMYQLLTNFLIHMKNVVVKAFEFDVNKIKNRLEILIGLIKAFNIVDVIIVLIQRSANKADAKIKLQEKYNFSEIQAEAITNLRLYRLSATDTHELKTEKIELENQLKHINLILNDPKELNNHLKNLILKFYQTFGYKRKTKLINNILNLDFDHASLISEKNLYYFWSKNQEIKILDCKKIEPKDLRNNKLKLNDFYRDFLPINNKDNLLFLTNLGNAYVLAVSKMELKKIQGTTNLISQYIKIDPHEIIVNIHRIHHELNYKNKTVLLTTQKGLTKQVLISDLIQTKTQQGIKAIKLNNEDFLISSIFIENKKGSVVFLSENNFLCHVLVNSINCLGRNSAGQKAMKLKGNDTIVSVLNVPQNLDAFLLLWFDQGIKKIKFNNQFELNRLASSGINFGYKNAKFLRAFFGSNQDHFWIQAPNYNISQLSWNEIKPVNLKGSINLILLIDLWKQTLDAKFLIYDQHSQEKEIIGLL